MSWRRYRDYDSGWAPYVPVAARRARGRREMDKLRKQGRQIEPVEIAGRAIAASFWGKAWCRHVESFGDYSNRLPRGRTYVRNGSVCHLGIRAGEIEAIVSGSSLYQVQVAIRPLAPAKWTTLKQRCTGRIGSLIELLQGRLSDEIMAVVTDREHGLFPLPGEIRFSCNCPDWAGMCKHIAAVIYGVGARLDTRPELLFLLRGVDHEELITAGADGAALTGAGSRRTRRRTLAGAALGEVFGVELEAAAAPPPSAGRRPAADTKAAKKTPAKAPRSRSAKKPKPAGTPAPQATSRGAATKGAAGRTSPRPPAFRPTARSIAALRRQLGMTKAQFARAIGVSAPTVTNWESTKGAIRPHAKGLAGLARLHQQGQQSAPPTFLPVVNPGRSGRR